MTILLVSLLWLIRSGDMLLYVHNKQIFMSNFNEFIEYCLSFYGPNGLYDQGRTREQVAYATLMYLDACNDQITWGDGDSLDRERVRDTMNELYD